MEYKILLTLIIIWCWCKKHSEEYALAAVLVNRAEPDKNLMKDSDSYGKSALLAEFGIALNLLYIIWSF